MTLPVTRMVPTTPEKKSEARKKANKQTHTHTRTGRVAHLHIMYLFLLQKCQKRGKDEKKFVHRR